MTATKTIAGIIAAHVTVLAFFFFKPKSHYFVVTCVSTVLVWSAAFAVKRFRNAAIVAATIIQFVVHQFAFRAWQADLSSYWWPFVQFAALQYMIFLTLVARDSLSPRRA